MAFFQPGDPSPTPAIQPPPVQPHPLIQALLNRNLPHSGLMQPQAAGLPTRTGGFVQTPAFAQSDPAYQAALAAQQQGLADAASQLKANREQELINFGDPSLAGQFSDLDPAAVAAIQANTNSGNSILAKLGQARDVAANNAINNLLARGLTRSGGLGVDEINVASNYAHNLHDAQQSALANLNTYLNNYMNQAQGLRQNVTNALQNSYQNYLDHPALYSGNTPASGSTVSENGRVAPTPAPRLVSEHGAAPAPMPVPHPVAQALARGLVAARSTPYAASGGQSATPAQGVISIH